MTDRLRVGVVLGGRSSEREISLESGRNIYYNLDPSRFEALAIYMDAAGRLWEIGLPLLVQNTTQDIEARLEKDAARLRYEDLPARVDFVYIGLHGKYGEDGCFQGLLELVGRALLRLRRPGQRLGHGQGRAAAPAAPGRHRRAARPGGDGRGLAGGSRAAVTAQIAEIIGLPCVVKPAREGCSTALAVVRAAEDLAPAIDEALRWDSTALVEELLTGVEVTVAVLEQDGEPYAYPPTETPPQGRLPDGRGEVPARRGREHHPGAPAGGDAGRGARRRRGHAFARLGLRAFARMDMYVTADGRIVVGEPNTLPGSSPSSTIFLGPIEEGIGPVDAGDPGHRPVPGGPRGQEGAAVRGRFAGHGVCGAHPLPGSSRLA